MNPELQTLPAYPFARLTALLRDTAPAPGLRAIDLSMGEPRHPTPPLLLEALRQALPQCARYPTTRGSAALRQAQARWLCRRFALPETALDPERQILPVNGSREALFAFAQAVIDRRRTGPLLMMPNPLYMIYEGAALLAGAACHYLPCLPEHGFRPDLDAATPEQWARCQLVYLCSPGNPTGAVCDPGSLERLLELADRYDFCLAADECYIDLYPDEQHPPPSVMQLAYALGRTDFRRILCFHSLSKRSNAPGLRSGFVAGDEHWIQSFLRYRVYHGCAMPPHTQAASIEAWNDDRHVCENRRLYREKFNSALEILSTVLNNLQRPEGGFYLWAKIPFSDLEFARRLYREQNVRVLPGSFLSRRSGAVDPGQGRLRIALADTQSVCAEAARRIRRCLETALNETGSH